MKSLSQDKSNMKIFLAHAVEDKPIIRELYQKLKQEGYRPWFDEEDILAGQQWPIEIAKSIESSDLFLACLSKHSIAKTGHVQKELKLALNCLAKRPLDHIYFIPLKLDKCRVPDLRHENYGTALHNIQWLDYYKQDGFSRLIQSIEYQREKIKALDKEPQRYLEKDDSTHSEASKLTEQVIVPVSFRAISENEIDRLSADSAESLLTVTQLDNDRVKCDHCGYTFDSDGLSGEIACYKCFNHFQLPQEVSLLKKNPRKLILNDIRVKCPYCSYTFDGDGLSGEIACYKCFKHFEL